VLSYGIKRDDLVRLRNLPKLVKIVPMRDTEQKVTHDSLRANANALGPCPRRLTSSTAIVRRAVFQPDRLRLAGDRLRDRRDGLQA